MSGDGGVRTALGLMSGTSMDGIDVGLIRTDGERIVSRGPSLTVAYAPELRKLLSRGIADAASLADRDARPGVLAELERRITEAHSDAVATYFGRAKLSADDIDIIGFHGQTVLHKPEAQLTVQLGDGDALARATGCRVAHDLRANDVALGGQGAPLASAYHAAMVADIEPRPIAILNIGGVANITWVGPLADELIAFDTGPGNAYLDDWMAKTVGASRDEGGAAAKAGTPDMRVVSFFLNDGYFAMQPPKSLDRNAFYWDMITGLSVEDGAATLVAMSVGAVERGLELLPSMPERVYVSGGGRHNVAMMDGLATALGCVVEPVDAIGFDGDAVEAEAWAFLAVRSDLGLPITFPGTTGVANPATGGRITQPNS
ncbi:MAG: anhydro-N-acetylmuramic acid kinase [Pseudomonadota bacterium]